MPQLCTFHLADLFLGVHVLEVQEVLRHRELTDVPLTPPSVRGLINLRGEIVTAIDLRRRIGLPDATGEDLPYNLVVRTEDGVVSLLVDAMGDVIEAPDEAFEPLPGNVQGVYRDVMRGVYKLDGKLLLVLDIEKAANVSSTA